MIGLAVGSLGGEAHRAAAVLGEQAGRDPHAVGLGVAHALVDDLQRRDVELDVGRRRARRRRGRSRRPRRGSRRTAPSGSASYSSSAAGSSASSRLSGSGVVHTSCVAGWSERFSPTAGWSSSTSISRIVQVFGRRRRPRASAAAASCRRRRRGSPRARRGTPAASPSCEASTPTARVPSNSTRCDLHVGHHRRGSAAPSPGAGRRPRCSPACRRAGSPGTCRRRPARRR